MTYSHDLDPMPETGGLFPPGSIDYQKTGIRVLPAQLSRICGVSKQAVSTWIKKGRVVLGSDGRVDPREAFDRLASTGDITKIRMKILEPFRFQISRRDTEISKLRQELAGLREKHARAVEDVEFHEGSCLELLEIFEALRRHLEDEYDDLLEIGPERIIRALTGWLEVALEKGSGDVAGDLLDHAASGAPHEWEEGVGNLVGSDICHQDLVVMNSDNCAHGND